MASPELNIVSFDVPFPPDYGGVIDVYFRLKALAEAGVKIHLHCFEYGRGRPEIPRELCTSVTWYPRKRAPHILMAKSPFIVETRRDPTLLHNLCQNAFPILFEGLHTTAWLDHPALANRLKLVRTHNIEHDYYQALARTEPRPWKRLFFKQEARKLKKFESMLAHADHILAISHADTRHFNAKYGRARTIPPFHPFAPVNRMGDRKKFALYHGNLSVRENREALKFLVREICAAGDISLIAAGHDADKALAELRAESEVNPAVSVVANPSEERMRALALEAAVHVLPTFQATGFKLKLLYALYTSPYVLVTPEMVEGTGLAPFCLVESKPAEIKMILRQILSGQGGEINLRERNEYLETTFSNRKNAEKIKALLL